MQKACEDIGTVDVITNVSTKLLIDHYIDQNIPVIVGDGAIDWPMVNDPDFSLDTIAKVIKDE